jgi:hypothetical protein
MGIPIFRYASNMFVYPKVKFTIGKEADKKPKYHLEGNYSIHTLN